MSNLFKHFMIEGSMLVLIAGGASACNDKPAPKPPTSQSPTDENGREIEVPIPKGCKGKIVNRVVDTDGTVTIIYYADKGCDATKSAKITEEQDLNSRCDEGYYPLCLTWWKTEPPNVRLPSEDPNN